MSTIKPTTNKSVDEETYKHMIPCGSYEMRKGNAETHGGDARVRSAGYSRSARIEPPETTTTDLARSFQQESCR
jgi:hypothetical protein